MGANHSNLHEANGSSSKSQVIEIHTSGEWKNHFEVSKGSSKLMVVDFWASWCGPCRVMAPIVEKFADKYTDVEFIKIDVDELPDVAREYAVLGMPTFVLIKRGKVVDEVRGVKVEELQKNNEKHRL